MIQHIWTVPCRLYIVDQQTNNVSLLDVLEELTLSPHAVDPGTGHPRYPAVFNVVSLWARQNPAQPEVGKTRLCLLSPAGDSLMEITAEVSLQEFRRLRHSWRIMGFPLAGTGRYHFRVERRADADADWEEVARVPLDIDVEVAPEAPHANGEAAH
jgi:hypothetical protein